MTSSAEHVTAAPTSEPNAARAPLPPARRHGHDLGSELPFSRSPLTVNDLLDGLLWPRLLRSASLALNPGRIWLASFLIVAVFALDKTWQALFGGGESPLMGCIANFRGPLGDLFAAVVPHVRDGTWVWTPDLRVAGGAVLELFITVPKGMIITPDGGIVRGVFATIVLLPVAVWLTAVIGGAICRSVAVEFATGRSIPWTKALAFAISRWGSLVGALVGPVVIAWIICLVLVAAGWLMKFPVVNLAGGMLFPLLLLPALLASLVMAAYIVGHMLLLPAVACDGADGFDAVQRAYAYAYGRPLRLVIYLTIMLVQGIVAFLLLASFLGLGVALAEQTTGFGGSATSAAAGDGVWLDGWTRGLVRFWIAVVWIAATSYGLSLYFAGSTVLYLLMRKLNDDHDPRDIWMPGMLEGTTPLAADVAAPHAEALSTGADQAGSSDGEQ